MKGTITQREADIFAQISMRNGMSKESIHVIKTSTGEDARMRVSAVDDFENYEMEKDKK